MDLGMRVFIVGKGLGWYRAPYKADNVWTINDAVLWRAYTSLAFQMHIPKKGHTLPEKMSEAKDICDSCYYVCKEKDIPIVTIEPIEGLNCVIYPLEEIIEQFGVDYFADGISYMLAYALYKGATRLDLFGVNMQTEHEIRTMQKGCVEFWLGMALGMGVEVKIHGEFSPILRTHDNKLYSYRSPQVEINDRKFRRKL